jgi:hypothetical protein
MPYINKENQGISKSILFETDEKSEEQTIILPVPLIFIHFTYK